MNDTNPNYVLFSIPRKQNDPTSYTSVWGNEYAKLAYNMGYTCILLRGNETNYEEINKALTTYKPRTYIHVGHGCTSNVLGQQECMLTTGQESQHNDNTCNATKCIHESNVDKLNGTIVYTIACYSSQNLGRLAVWEGGCESYTGYRELMLFPVDNNHIDNLFRDAHMTFLKYLFAGSSVYEAEQKMKEYEDNSIRRYKSTKYVALPFLWNSINRESLGNRGARIWR